MGTRKKAQMFLSIWLFPCAFFLFFVSLEPSIVPTVWTVDGFFFYVPHISILII